MRNELSKRDGLRGTFRGTFVRRGSRKGWKGAREITILLSDVVDTHGNLVTDHLWFNETKGFAELGLKRGDIVEFTGRVEPYWKGNRGWYDADGRELDYKLTRPTNVRKVVIEEIQTLPLFSGKVRNSNQN